MFESLRQGRVGPAVRWIEAHPRLAAWFVLALGMNVIFVIAGRDVGLLPRQWAAVLTASTLTAGLCIWIISWEDEPIAEEDEAKAQSPAPAEAEAPPPKAAPKKRARKAKTQKS